MPEVVTKQQPIVGYTRHRLVTQNGVSLDLVLAPTHATDLTIGEALVRGPTALIVIGDNGSISAAVAASLAAIHRLQLLTIPRRNQHQQVPQNVAAWRTARRHISETVHEQLTDQLGLETTHAHSGWERCARWYTMLTAHTVSM